MTTLTNSHTPETTELTVIKVWNDENNRDGIRPASLAVTLSNGMTVMLSEENSWTAVITDLPVFADGKPVEYTWKEQAVIGYNAASVETADRVTVITNTLWERPAQATEGAEAKTAGRVLYDFREYETPLGVDVQYSQVGDCFD